MKKLFFGLVASLLISSPASAGTLETLRAEVEQTRLDASRHHQRIITIISSFNDEEMAKAEARMLPDGKTPLGLVLLDLILTLERVQEDANTADTAF